MVPGPSGWATIPIEHAAVPAVFVVPEQLWLVGPLPGVKTRDPPATGVVPASGRLPESVPVLPFAVLMVPVYVRLSSSSVTSNVVVALLARSVTSTARLAVTCYCADATLG